MKHAEALMIAQEWVERLRPSCTRIEVAGSIRRGKDEPSDIEIVAIPDLTPPPMPRAVFGQKMQDLRVYKTRLEAILAEFEEDVSNGISLKANGPKYKKLHIFRHGGFLIQLDLFLVTWPATWGVQYVIRTGPGSDNNNFSEWIVTQRHLGGQLPNGYRVQKGAVWEGELKVPEEELASAECIGFDEEMDFLNFLELGWIEPGERRAKWAR